MIIRNETSQPIFLGWVGKNGRTLGAFPETTELNDLDSQNESLKRLYSNGDISVVSFNNDFLDYVVQGEIGGGGGSNDLRGPTVIVGNSAEGDTLSEAEFLDDIQSAINSISKGCVYIRRGTYNISTILTLKSNIKLLGEGISTVLVKAPGALGIFDFTGASQVIIQNMKLTADATPTDGTSFMDLNSGQIDISQNTIDFSGASAGTMTSFIEVSTTTNRIFDNRFSGDNKISNGVNLSGVTDTEVRGNRFDMIATPINGSFVGNYISHNVGV